MTLRKEENCKYLLFGSICGIKHAGLMRSDRIFWKFQQCTNCIDKCNANCPYRSGKDLYSLHFNLDTYAWEDRIDI